MLRHLKVFERELQPRLYALVSSITSFSNSAMPIFTKSTNASSITDHPSPTVLYICFMLFVLDSATCLHKCNMAARLKNFLCDKVLGVSLIRSFSDQMTFFIRPEAIDELTALIFSSAGQTELHLCCVTSFGFAVTTLEEIFLKLGKSYFRLPGFFILCKNN